MELAAILSMTARMPSSPNASGADLAALMRIRGVEQGLNRRTLPWRRGRREKHYLQSTWAKSRTAVVIAMLAMLFVVGCASDPGSQAPSGNCDPNYEGACVPNVSYDLDCADVGTMVRVVGDDPNGFDADGDGYGCESYG
jgi:hypothetical protein